MADLESNCVDLDSISAPSFIADYHMYGSAMGTLNIDISNDGGWSWTTLWTASGNQGNQWLTAVIDLSAYASQVVQMRMSYTSGTSFTGDCAIDNLRFESLPATGCTDTLACNYDSSAVIDDGSCYTLSASVSESAISCNGGSDGALTLSSNAPVLASTLWSNGSTSTTIDSLSTGTYSVVVTDPYGCSDTVSVSLAEPTAISASMMIGDETAAGAMNGSIDLTASGGVSCIVSSSLSSHNASLSQNGSSGCHFNITNTSTSPVVITDIAQGTYTYSGANTITVYSMPGPYSHTTNTTTGTVDSSWSSNCYDA